MTEAIEEPELVGMCLLCEIPMCSAKVKPPRGAWFDRHLGRGLCKSCYGVHRRAGTLDQFDRLTRPREEVLADWSRLRSSGLTRQEAAGRMGMAVGAIDSAYYRMARRQNANRVDEPGKPGYSDEVSVPAPAGAIPRKAKEGTTMSDDRWDGALCRDEDPELFFPVGSKGPAAEQIERAKEVCRRCPLIEQCREEMESWGPGVCGVWAATSEEDRIEARRLARRLARA